MDKYIDAYFLIEVIGEDFTGRPVSGWKYKRFEGRTSPMIVFQQCGDHLEWPIKEPPSDEESDGSSVLLSSNVISALGMQKRD